MNPGSLLTTRTAAAELGISALRVRQLIAAGRLRAVRAGRDWLIEPKALAAVRVRKVGRPAGFSPKAKAART